LVKAEDFRIVLTTLHAGARLRNTTRRARLQSKRSRAIFGCGCGARRSISLQGISSHWLRVRHTMWKPSWTACS
jgi:hypothetical protein